MYQALYRKWRPQSFVDVVGQAHITDTLQRQVDTARLSHAYLFTGTRGTGKTSCAKILAKAINCEQPERGNPCNRCASCCGIDSGSILDVLELDAASNNGVDQVRALRDEAVYTPAAVKKRVYIIDEVHMLSTPAFNALLKILEEPPAHLLFILATTELHKVPATIKSRCQQFSFKRILPEEIAARLRFVAQQEGLALSEDAARLLARLAEGGLRDALSLLDQCAGGGEEISERTVLQVLGLAGSQEIVRLMEQVVARDTEAALQQLGLLYREGKDMSALLGELSTLLRDLMLRKTAPKGGEVLQSGSFEEAALRALSAKLGTAELFQMLTHLQNASAELYRSSNRRTDVELCLIRLCEAELSTAPEALLARIGRLEEKMAQGIPVPEARSAQPVVLATNASVSPLPVTAESITSRQTSPPPWEEPTPEKPSPLRELVVEPVPRAQQAAPTQAQTEASTPTLAGRDWKQFAASLRGKVPPSAFTFLGKTEFVSGVFDEQALWLYVDSEMTKAILSKADVQQALTEEAARYAGRSLQLHLKIGAPEGTEAANTQTEAVPDKLGDLLKLGQQFGNITIK